MLCIRVCAGNIPVYILLVSDRISRKPLRAFICKDGVFKIYYNNIIVSFLFF